MFVCVRFLGANTVESKWLTLKSCWLLSLSLILIHSISVFVWVRRECLVYFFFFNFFLSLVRTLSRLEILAFQFSTNECQFIESHIVDSSMAGVRATRFNANGTNIKYTSTHNHTHREMRTHQMNHSAQRWFSKHNILTYIWNHSTFITPKYLHFQAISSLFAVAVGITVSHAIHASLCQTPVHLECVQFKL